jgi:arginine N-succinyltransferase
MLIVRSVVAEDLDPLFELIQKSEYGLTTLKISKERLNERIEQAIFAFGQKKSRPNGQPYVFVMEDLASGGLVGTCAIYSKVGGYEPFYSYEIKKSVHRSDELGVHKEIEVLHLMEEHNGPTEIGSLFLSPTYWGGGHGRLLSMARFLFMADFPDRFEDEVFPDWISEGGNAHGRVEEIHRRPDADPSDLHSAAPGGSPTGDRPRPSEHRTGLGDAAKGRI